MVLRTISLVAFLTIVIPAITTMTTIPSAEGATTSLNSIGITISKSCLMSDHCLKYRNIMYLDNSNKKQLGFFVEKNGDYSRQYTPRQNNAEWLRFSDQNVIVDPPSKVADRIRIIYVVPQLDEYHDTGQYVVKESKVTSDAKATQAVRVYSTNRSVDSHCNKAIITAKDWLVILPDTISYLQHDCDPKFTKIKTTVEIKTPITKHDISTSTKYKLDKFYDMVKQDCTKSRNACTTLDNKAVSTMGDTK